MDREYEAYLENFNMDKGDLPAPPPPSNDSQLWELFWATVENRIVFG